MNNSPSENDHQPELLRNNTDTSLTSDLGMWPSSEYWISKGGKECQHKDTNFASSQRYYNENVRRLCTPSLFIHTNLSTGECNERTWLCYSPTKGCLYCFPCKVTNIYHPKLTDEGFNDWKHAASTIQTHEQSGPHRSALISMLSRQKANNRIDANLQQEVEKEKVYWPKVLERIVEVICFMSERGLAFRGDNKTMG